MNKRKIKNTFNIYHYSDGKRMEYGNETNLEIQDAIENLIYYDIVNSKYSEDELENKLKNLDSDFCIRKWGYEINVTKNN